MLKKNINSLNNYFNILTSSGQQQINILNRYDSKIDIIGCHQDGENIYKKYTSVSIRKNLLRIKITGNTDYFLRATLEIGGQVYFEARELYNKDNDRFKIF
jgi:hypothetical protein